MKLPLRMSHEAVWYSESNALLRSECAAHNIVITESKCVYCAVRTEPTSPCQYHSTNAPYSFIHLPPTLYNVSLPVLQFPLSVSFHQCSILMFNYTLLLPGQKGEACEPSKMQCCFWNLGALDRKVLLFLSLKGFVKFLWFEADLFCTLTSQKFVRVCWVGNGSELGSQEALTKAVYRM
jgi:hypothetical protein